MPELLLELFSEEIPARMQARAADDLARMVGAALAALAPAGVGTFHGPRRIALVATVAPAIAAVGTVERGPRISAPEQALAGFLRKHGASRDMLVQDGDYWMLHKQAPAQDAASVIAAALPPLLRRFPWPKSMRWGGSGSVFTWVRPLRRILCLLDGETVPFSLAEGEDDGHGLCSGDVTEGHGFMAPAPFPVRSASEWQAGLLACRVIVDAGERRRRVAEGVAALAAKRGMTVVEDPALLDEVAGLVEWPVPLLGRIDAAYMDLPAEVMQVSMRVNQRYFALRTADDDPAPYFAFAANIEAPDGGAAIVAGNERVLRARFSDARHFWDSDRKIRLGDRVAALDGVTFHAKLGTQGKRIHRVVALAERIATLIGADTPNAGRAALLAKADLTAGMVGEFPELQGVMGRYYALHDGEDPAVADAVRDHYLPKGPADKVPTAPITVAVALADKIDQIASLFCIGEVPTGSGDPYALRRAALGILRIVFDNALRLPMGELSALNNRSLPAPAPVPKVMEFLLGRARVFLRDEGVPVGTFDAVAATDPGHDLYWLRRKVLLLHEYLEHSTSGREVVSLYRRANNIARAEDAKDGPHEGDVDAGLFAQPEEHALLAAVAKTRQDLGSCIAEGRDNELVSTLGGLRRPMDAFFDQVTVNDSDPSIRRNRLRLLHLVRAVMDSVADFSRIEG